MAPLKRRLTELFVRKLRPRPPPSWCGTRCNAASPSGYSRPAQGVEVHLRPPRPNALAAPRRRQRHRPRRRPHAGGRGDARGRQGQRPGCREEGRARRRHVRRAGRASYVEQHAKKHNKSWKQADALVRRYALPRWGKLQASTITRGDVKALMARIEAPMLANQTLAAVSAIFTWAVSEEMVTANPCKLVDRNPTRAASAFWPTPRCRCSGRRSTTPASSSAPRSRRSCSPASAPARSRTCAASTSRTAGGRCPASRCRRWAGPARRTAHRIASGCRRRCRR